MSMKIKFLSAIIACTPYLYIQPITQDLTHVYVRNYTPLQFEVIIEPEGIPSTDQSFFKIGSDIINPFSIPEEKSMLLEINRLVPNGEYVYSIRLKSGIESVNLKQKCVSLNFNSESELGISLETFCIHDPWFMKDEAKCRHEHLLCLNGHTIVIVYYSYDTPTGEDVDYVFYERIEPYQELSIQNFNYSKTLAYSLAIPLFNKSLNTGAVPKLINRSVTCQALAQKIILANKRSALSKTTLQHMEKYSDQKYVLEAIRSVQIGIQNSTPSTKVNPTIITTTDTQVSITLEKQQRISFNNPVGMQE